MPRSIAYWEAVRIMLMKFKLVESFELSTDSVSRRTCRWKTEPSSVVNYVNIQASSALTMAAKHKSIIISAARWQCIGYGGYNSHILRTDWFWNWSIAWWTRILVSRSSVSYKLRLWWIAETVGRRDWTLLQLENLQLAFRQLKCLVLDSPSHAIQKF